MEPRPVKTPAFGFLRSARARHAEEAIDHSEGLVTVLRLTQVDLKPAEDALRVAKELFAAQQYSKAIHAAKRAEQIAVTLDERFSGYQKSVQTLQTRIADLKRIGLPTEALEAVLGQAEEKVVAGIWENGAFVPNYLEARALLDKAAEEGRDLLLRANAASNRIFLAELAIEALADTQGFEDPKAFAEVVLADLERALEEATRELALGHVDAAMRIATDLEARAEKLRREALDVLQDLEATERRLGDLRAEGIVTERIERQIAFARGTLSKGLIQPAKEMARRLADETTALEEAYQEAATGLQDAELLYSQLLREGFHSYEADSAIRDARRALREGNYARAREHLERAHKAFLRRRNAREALAKALEETRKRVEVLKGSAYSFLPDLHEILSRAEREFRNGNYSGSSEDLQIAAALLNQATKGPSPKA